MTKASSGFSRRRLLASAGAGLGATMLLEQSGQANTSEKWDDTADVVVVGSGAAALSAAIAAKAAGVSVIVLERAPVVGGTTAKSDGAYWIPNNHLMQAAGLTDPKADAIAYMAKYAYPTLYRPGAPQLGLTPNSYGLIERYFDQGAAVIEALFKDGTLRGMMARLPDYIDHAPENRAPVGRIILPTDQSGAMGGGRELVRQLRNWLDARSVPFRLKTRVEGLERNGQGEVTGITASVSNGALRIRARKAVVFGSGGFTHNSEMMTSFQPGPIFGGCAVPTNQGDFVHIGGGAGAKLGNMVNGWRAQLLLEAALATPSVAREVWQPPGDSMILVNAKGDRVVDEKRNYHERSRVHFVWDPLESEYPNRLLFMIYDQRTAELYAGNYPLPAVGNSAKHVITGRTLAELADALSVRLAALAPQIGEAKLAPNFAAALKAQIARYNRDARDGIDRAFGRGRYPYDDAWHSAVNSVPRSDTRWPAPSKAHPTLHPIAGEGPFHAIILGAGMLDTNGGPVTDPDARVLDRADRPIPGLYGAGNCVASPAGAAYWGAGGTIGPALVFGTIAGCNAAAEPEKSDI